MSLLLKTFQQRTQYQTEEELYKTLYILFGSFLLLVIWLLIVTLAVLCKRKHFKQQDDDVTNQEEDCDKNTADSDRRTFEPKEVFPRNFTESDENYHGNNITPDVVQTVKLWYVWNTRIPFQVFP